MKHQLSSGDILTPQVTQENVLYKNLCTRIYFGTIIVKKIEMYLEIYNLNYYKIKTVKEMKLQIGKIRIYGQFFGYKIIKYISYTVVAANWSNVLENNFRCIQTKYQSVDLPNLIKMSLSWRKLCNNYYAWSLYQPLAPEVSLPMASILAIGIRRVKFWHKN